MDFRKPNKIGKVYKKYRQKNQNSPKNYNFYERVKSEDGVVEDLDLFIIAKNLFGYQIWDGFEVEEHLLVIPKRFVEGINEFSKQEFDEFQKILAKYEAKGFSIYARAPKNKSKTVMHQHTHLIIHSNQRLKWLISKRGKFLWWGTRHHK